MLWRLELVYLQTFVLRHASVGSTAEIGYLIRIPGVRSEQPYVAVDTSLVRVSVIRDIVDHI